MGTMTQKQVDELVAAARAVLPKTAGELAGSFHCISPSNMKRLHDALPLETVLSCPFCRCKVRRFDDVTYCNRCQYIIDTKAYDSWAAYGAKTNEAASGDPWRRWRELEEPDYYGERFVHCLLKDTSSGDYSVRQEDAKSVVWETPEDVNLIAWAPIETPRIPPAERIAELKRGGR